MQNVRSRKYFQAHYDCGDMFGRSISGAVRTRSDIPLVAADGLIQRLDVKDDARDRRRKEVGELLAQTSRDSDGGSFCIIGQLWSGYDVPSQG